MKRNLFVLFLALALVATMLVSCGDKCDHTFSENWESNATHHWHPATCEHGEIKDSYAEHVDANDDGICDVCANDEIGHECTYAEEWESDEFYHWHEPTCSHTEKGSYELHSDNNIDCICDLCGGHVHAMNIIGYCADKACGKKLKDEADIENFDIAFVIYSTGIGYDNINGGKYIYDFEGRSNTSDQYEATAHKVVDYILGNGFTYTKTESSATNDGVSESDTVEHWFEVDGSGVFGVQLIEGAEKFDIVAASTNHLYGYYCALSSLADGHGAENILYSIYEASQSAFAKDFDYSLVKEKGTASFSYKVALVNNDTAEGEGAAVNYFEVSVSFTFAEQYALTSLNVTVDSYTRDPGVSQDHGFLEDDVDFDYNEETGEITLRDNALPDTYTITVTQTVGERTAENEHPKSSFIPESFEIFYDAEATKPIGNHVSINVNEFFYIYLDNFTPDSATYISEVVRFEVLDANGNLLITSLGTVYEPLLFFRSDEVVGYFNCTDGAEGGKSLVFSAIDEGDYTYNIYLGNEIIYTVTIHANKVTAPTVQVGDNQFAVQTFAPYAPNKVAFVAETAGTYTFTFEDNLTFVNADEYDAADADGVVTEGEFTVYYDFQDPFAEKDFTFSLELDAGETIRFYVTSDKGGIYVVDYSVN